MRCAAMPCHACPVVRMMCVALRSRGQLARLADRQALKPRLCTTLLVLGGSFARSAGLVCRLLVADCRNVGVDGVAYLCTIRWMLGPISLFFVAVER